MNVPEITACRSCGSERLAEVFDLGLFALSDFVESDQVDYAPLVWLRCADCTLVQLKHTVPRDRLYREYWYRSGVQESMVKALQDVVDHATSLVKLRPGDVVVDIGANDGTMLRMYPYDVLRFGFEPARNLYFKACEGGNCISQDYFPPPWRLRGKAKIITSIACFYDVDDPNAFVKAIKEWLHPDGVWINQLAYLPDTLRTNNVGDICHEHLTYWAVDSFSELAKRHDMAVELMHFNDVNGGSVRFTVRHDKHKLFKQFGWHEAPSLDDLDHFRERVKLNRMSVLAALTKAKNEGKKVLGYGASTKGNTYLQYWGVGTDLLPAIADRNPDKWGKRTAGTGIPIISEEQMRAERPDFLLVLPWHFLDSFMGREREFLERGGKFIVPFPQLRVVGLEDARLPAQVA